MLRFNILRRIGIESDIYFRSMSKDKQFLHARISQLGVAHKSVAETGAVVAQSAHISQPDLGVNEHGEAVNTATTTTSNDNSDNKNKTDTFSRKLTQQELNRFTTSLGSRENLHNQAAGVTPSLTVDENGNVEGQNYPDPTRYGDWEYNGRCYDF